MSSAAFHRIRRLLFRAVLAVALLTLLAAALFFRSAGRYLVAEDPLATSDAIVVLAGARVERWLEAVDLYHEGWAPHIVLSNGRTDDLEVLLRTRGIRLPGEAEAARDAMVQMKVPADAIEILTYSLDNTAQEAQATRELAGRHRWHRLIVVTSKYHSRRTSFAFRREFRGTPVQIRIRASRHDLATPDRWWTDRADVRYVTLEFQKLLAYRLGVAE